MKILIWIIVALVIVGGLAWFMSGDKETSTNTQQNSLENTGITESSSIGSDDQVFTEIDNALSELE
ncbi:MAG: hypothetical protein AABX23_01420 [Nanoarchaeota archaeon]